MLDDERPVYDDRLYFTRRRAGFRPDPTPKVNHIDLIVCACAVVIIVAVFFYARLSMPVIQ